MKIVVLFLAYTLYNCSFCFPLRDMSFTGRLCTIHVAGPYHSASSTNCNSHLLGPNQEGSTQAKIGGLLHALTQSHKLVQQASKEQMMDRDAQYLSKPLYLSNDCMHPTYNEPVRHCSSAVLIIPEECFGNTGGRIQMVAEHLQCEDSSSCRRKQNHFKLRPYPFFP